MGRTGKCGLYGWVLFHSKICKNGYILDYVHMGLTLFIRIRPKIIVKYLMVVIGFFKNCQNREKVRKCFCIFVSNL